jgi:CxxC-x17-CxxC domain-containing protein
MPFLDKQLKCKDCGADFVFSARQQEHHASLGLRNEPRRCAICRQVNRMKNDDRRGGFGGPPRGPRPPRPGFDRGPRPGPAGPGAFAGPRESFQAVCAACGKPCDLPFKPRGDRPVYCRDCFRSRK